MKNGKWSLEEDTVLRDHIEKYGLGRSWQMLANNTGLNRCGRSCRSRWLNYLRPGLKHGNFTEEEDGVISDLYRRKGRSWSLIAARLPGRTDLSVKNYWNCKLSKQVAQQQKNKKLELRVRPGVVVGRRGGGGGGGGGGIDRLPPAPIAAPSAGARDPDRGLPSSPARAASETELPPPPPPPLPSGGSISEPSSGSTSAAAASENLVADHAALEIEQPPEFGELVEWYVMSPARHLAADFPHFSSFIDGLEDVNSSNLLLSDRPWW